MEVYEIIVVAFLVTFIASIFLGYPIAWTLGGLSLLFAAGGIVLHDYFGVDTFLLTRWGNFCDPRSTASSRPWRTGCSSPCPCSSTWA